MKFRQAICEGQELCKELDDETQRCLNIVKAPGQILGDDLCKTLMKNEDACKTFLGGLENCLKRLRCLMEEVVGEDLDDLTASAISFETGTAPLANEKRVETDLRGQAITFDGFGLAVTDLFTSFGWSVSGSRGPPRPVHTAVARQGVPEAVEEQVSVSFPVDAKLVAEMDLCLKEISGLEIGSLDLKQQGYQLFGRTAGLKTRWTKVQYFFPQLLQAIEDARISHSPLPISNLVWTLQESMSWRKAVVETCVEAESLTQEFQHASDFMCMQQKEISRWKALSVETLDGLDEVGSARIVACMWLQDKGVKDPDLGVQALVQNLKVAKNLERSLVKCAGLVMRFTSRFGVVKRVVRKLGKFRSFVATASADADHAMSMLSSSTSFRSLRDTDEAASALEELLHVIDQVCQLLRVPDTIGHKNQSSAARKVFPQYLEGSGDLSEDAQNELMNWVDAVAVCRRRDADSSDTDGGEGSNEQRTDESEND